MGKINKKESNHTERGKDPTPKTLHLLWGNAAGCCEFSGCGKRLTYDELSKIEANFGQAAHSISSNPNGPRGNEKSHELSDKLENLLLLCYDHHCVIDKEGVDVYPDNILIAMKESHEEKVKKLTKLLVAPETYAIAFQSPIKGRETNVDLKKAMSAIKNKYCGNYRKIEINSNFTYGTEEYWNDVSTILDRKISEIKGIFEDNKNMHLSIFPLAPMPLIIKLGAELADKVPIDVYQFDRQTNSWEWPIIEDSNFFDFELIKKESDNKNVGLIISLTADKKNEVMSQIDLDNFYTIKARKFGIDSIQSDKDLNAFWLNYQKVCDDIIKTFGNQVVIHLFPCAPVSAIFEIGRRRMPMVYPDMIIYDNNDGKWSSSIIIKKECL